jgi:hypothetical protein
MATEALKFLGGLAIKTGNLSLYDAISSEWRTVAIRKRKNCVCS